MFKEQWREPVVLASGLWALNFVAHLALNVWINLPPFFHLLAAIWSLHGLLLTWPLHLLLLRTSGSAATLRWMLIGAAVAALTVVQVRLDMFFHNAVAPWAPDVGPVGIMLLRGDDPLRNIGPDISLMIYFWVFSCYAVAANLLLAQRRLFDTERRARKAELEALRLQLNPHFLFNALNSVSSLIVTGRHDEAERTTLSLADFLQGALTAPEAGLTPLEDELATLEAYLQIETVRFGDRLQVEIDTPSGLDRLLVPSFVLQPLVENAVKYAVAPANRPVTVRVTAEAHGATARLVVADDGCPERAAGVRGGTKVGLRTTRERLRALYEDAARLETEPGPKGFTATLSLPLTFAPARPLTRPELSRAA